MSERQRCYLRISIAGGAPRTIAIDLDTETCPKTCANFLSFCTSSPSSAPSIATKTYRNTIFHRIIPGFMAQGGDYQKSDGTGGEPFNSSGARHLEDENFTLRHDRAGVVSMANAGKNTAGSQFFILLGRASHLDGKHVAFGSVAEGMDVVKAMGEVETDDMDRPVNMQKITVTDCGAGDYRKEGDHCSDGSSSVEKEAEEEEGRKSRNKVRKKSRKKKKKKDHRRDRDDDDSEYDDDRKRTSRRKHHKSSRSSSHRRSSRHYSDTDDSESSASSHSSDRSKRRSKKSYRSSDHKSHKKQKEKNAITNDNKHNDDTDGVNDSSTNAKLDKKHRKSRSRSKDNRKRTKRSRRYYSDGDDSSASSSSSASSHSRRRHRRRKDKDKKKKKRAEKQQPTKEKPPVKKPSATPTFGTYGIVTQSIIQQSSKAKLSVEKWMAEIKGIPEGSSVAKWEMAEYFKEYVEDFNTATLPHMKYYDYGKWEMEEYEKKKGEAQSKKGAISDEFLHVEAMRRNATEKKRIEMGLVISTMNHGKVKEMKRQAELKAQLENAYRVGDQKKVKQIKRRLEPDEK